MLSTADPLRRSRGAACLLHCYKRSAGAQARPWTLRSLPVCASTENVLAGWIQRHPQLPGPRAVIASRQRYGFGQWGRPWSSPAGGLWISAVLPWMESGRGRAGLLGLAVAVAIAERLEARGLPVRIKWPNDLLIGSRKLAGLLPGVVQRGSQIRQLRIGLGLNVRNRVPPGALALHQLPGLRSADPCWWGGQILLAFDRCMDRGGDGSWCLPVVERLLWADRVRDPSDGRMWRISGIGSDGALLLRDGKSLQSWHRWP